MKKHCLGCDIEFEGSAQARYHNEACSDKARKRKQREKEGGGVEEEKDPEIKTEEVVDEPLDPSLRNTIHDPNPEWNPNKIVTSSNRTMVCPVCGKLSLTHTKMCVASNPIGGFRYTEK